MPLSIGVLIDHSGSMEKRIDDAKAAALEFFKGIMKQGDKVFVAGFAGDPSRNAPFVTQIPPVEGEGEGMPAPGGRNGLFRPILPRLYRFRNLQGRKALVVI